LRFCVIKFILIPGLTILDINQVFSLKLSRNK
jgi:hypothetical protein